MKRKNITKAIVSVLSAILLTLVMVVGYTVAANHRPTKVRNLSEFSDQEQPEEPLIQAWVEQLGGDAMNVNIRYDRSVLDKCQSVICMDGEGLVLPQDLEDKGEFSILYRRPVYQQFSNTVTFVNSRSNARNYFNENLLVIPRDNYYEGYKGETLLLYYTPEDNSVVYSIII